MRIKHPGVPGFGKIHSLVILVLLKVFCFLGLTKSAFDDFVY